MEFSVRKKMSEEQIFAQELSDEELELISAGNQNYGDVCSPSNSWEKQHCSNFAFRHIYEGAFPNCAATVEDGSLCGSNDACLYNEVTYMDMKSCLVAWE